MDKNEIREKYSNTVRALIKNYLQEQRGLGRSINEINPWKELENNLVSLASDAADGTNYPVKEEGWTTGLMIIEQELNTVFKDEYGDYSKNNPLELKIEEIVADNAKKLVDNFSKNIEGEISERNPFLKVWLRMIDENKSYLLLKLVRNEKTARAVVRNIDEIELFLNKAIDKRNELKKNV